jgi:hypothetical protein
MIADNASIFGRKLADSHARSLDHIINFPANGRAEASCTANQGPLEMRR